MSDNLFCIVGPSGSGKTTLCNNLEKYGYKTVESYTTRKPRYKGERGHIFITQDEFDKLDLITKTVFSGASYGVTADLLDESDTFVCDLAGIEYLKQRYNNKNIIVVALKLSPEDCKNRMFKRGETECFANSRLDHDKEAFKDLFNACDYTIDVSITEQETVKAFLSIVTEVG